MGHVLLAELDESELDAFPQTRRCECDRDDKERVRNAIADLRRQGWAMVDQELQDGLRSMVVPIRNSDRRRRRGDEPLDPRLPQNAGPPIR